MGETAGKGCREGQEGRKVAVERYQATAGNCFAGRRPRRPTALLKEDGGLTRGPTEVKQRWYDHFTSILNVHSQY